MEKRVALWEMQFADNTLKNKPSYLFVRMHHSFTDSIGFVSLMSCLLDNQ